MEGQFASDFYRFQIGIRLCRTQTSNQLTSPWYCFNSRAWLKRLFLAFNLGGMSSRSVNFRPKVLRVIVDFNKPIERNKLIPFDRLAESEHTSDGQLNEYYHHLALKTLTLFKNFIRYADPG